MERPIRLSEVINIDTLKSLCEYYASLEQYDENFDLNPCSFYISCNECDTSDNYHSCIDHLQYMITIPLPNGKEIHVVENSIDLLIHHMNLFIRCTVCHSWYPETHKNSKCIECLKHLLYYPKDDNCVICLEPLRNARVIELHCSHQFHLQCWRNSTVHTLYSSQVVKCPLCRKNWDGNDYFLMRSFLHFRCPDMKIP